MKKPATKLVAGFFIFIVHRKGRRSLHPFRPKSYHKLNLLMLWRRKNTSIETNKKEIFLKFMVFFIRNWG